MKRTWDTSRATGKFFFSLLNYTNIYLLFRLPIQLLSPRPSPPPPLPSQATQMSDKRSSGLSFHFTLHHHLPCHLKQPRWATSAHLGYPFTSAFTTTSLAISFRPDEQLVACLGYSFTTSFTTTSLDISSSPDEWQALVWALFSHRPSPPPPSPSHPAQMSYKHLSRLIFFHHSTQWRQKGLKLCLEPLV